MRGAALAVVLEAAIAPSRQDADGSCSGTTDGNVSLAVPVDVGDDDGPAVHSNRVIHAVTKRAIAEAGEDADGAIVVEDGQIKIAVAVKVSGCDGNRMTAYVKVSCGPETSRKTGPNQAEGDKRDCQTGEPLLPTRH